ncbi:protein cereblon-like isoform X1 [Pocillopora damicornis]|uniref:protein cereblon-like isoform X1 n=1 Tax=Pocillopora damicornis TaxID=46731 RepID=UPI000F55766C|nr:protein cereblon-like isoform X1 [Pocillopora damicornis]
MKSHHWNRFLALVAIVCLSVDVAFSTIVEIQQHQVCIFADTLLCRRCGQDISVAANLNNLGSKLALRQRNDTILGVKQCLIQLFKNPHGQHFELITVTSANIKSLGEAFEEHSWFPGYAWRVAVCSQCGVHMGWSFEHRHPKDYVEKTSKFWDDLSSHKEQNKGNSRIIHSFVGLIYPNLIEEHYADSLIVTPKAYRS